jgi:hypothetical protein
MTEATREQAAPLHQEGAESSTHWVRRTLLVVFSLGLLTAVGAVFTQVIAARVPEQRATLEKLIADRTGLQVRFDDVHFAWTLDGTSAVFERVELTDPVRGRVRVVAPELRVEFDAWDFIRHQQFSLGHVTLSSPDIDIIGDPEPVAAARGGGKPRVAAKTELPAEDEAALVRRFTSWAELMPIGRVEVDGARVHLFRRGERVARHDFTLSQAVVSRGNSSFTAFGTMLLSQDLGQSLFVSVKLEGVGGQAGPSGELRLIARRVLLDKLPGLAAGSAGKASALAARGRGTVDARLSLKTGRVASGEWQLSGREIELQNGFRFDHFTVNGALSRAGDDVLLDFTDLQVTRGARLERTEKFSARLTLAPGSVRVAKVSAQSDRVPFMAAELIAGALAPAIHERLGSLPADWSPTAGELRSVSFDSRAATFSAQVSGAELTRAADRSRLTHLAARVDIDPEVTRVSFEGADGVQLHLEGLAEPRALQLSGAFELRQDGMRPELQFASLRLRSGDSTVVADGPWSGAANAPPLAVEVSRVDRATLGDAWQLLALDGEWPQLAGRLNDVEQGRIVTGKLSLLAMQDERGRRTVNWARSRGTLEIAGLASAGADTPRLESAAGQLEFSRGATRLRLTSGRVEDLRVSDARLEWPRDGEPRLRASLQGDLQSPLLSRTLQERGLQHLKGAVTLEAEARGDAEMRDAALWRVSARVSNASIPLAKDLPPVEKLNGTVRIANGQLRGLSLEGSWLGGPVEIESRRAGAEGVSAATLSGTADAAPLLGLLGQRGAAGQVSGRVAWTGTVQRNEKDWQVTLGSDLAGVESHLPEPFDKSRSRTLAVSAGLRFDEHGIREFEIESGRDSIRGRVDGQVTHARFAVQGVEGDLRTADNGEDSRLDFDRLDVKRAPMVLAAAGALLPADSEMRVSVADLRHAQRGLGALTASLARSEDALRFSLESAPGAPHELNASGRCESPGDACRFGFTLQTDELRALLGDARLPAEWPTKSLRASGELNWRADASIDIARALRGEFELETQGEDSTHQLVASATLSDGQIELTNVQGTGPGPDQVFRGQGRVGLLARTYDLSVDYERVSLAATGMPTPARARIARAWTALRGSAARQGWAETQPSRRVQWHGTWDGDIPARD